MSRKYAGPLFRRVGPFGISGCPDPRRSISEAQQIASKALDGAYRLGWEEFPNAIPDHQHILGDNPDYSRVKNDILCLLNTYESLTQADIKEILRGDYVGEGFCKKAISKTIGNCINHLFRMELVSYNDTLGEAKGKGRWSITKKGAAKISKYLEEIED